MSSIGTRLLTSVQLMLLTVLLSTVQAYAQQDYVRLEVELLPDMHIPRAGHVVFAIGDELVAIGGHTDGFVPTATAEYYSHGQWHELKTVYDHDHALSVRMKSGQVLIAGGHLQPLGIGQTFTVELYDPAAHTFEGYGCLDLKRCFSTALELDSGRVVVSGNWFTDDGIECFDGSRQFQPVKEVTIDRTRPYMLRTAKDDAIIFGSRGNRDQILDPIVIDRLQGEAYTEPLLRQWRPIAPRETHCSTDYLTGDEEAGDYSYLVAATDTVGHVGIIRVCNGSMALLPTEKPIPVKVDGQDIHYLSNFIVDRARKRAYLTGCTHQMRLCVVSVDYTQTPAPFTFFCSDPMPGVGYHPPVLNAQGDLVMVGGINDSNFNPLASAVVLHVAKRVDSPVNVEQAGSGWWPWLLVVLVAVLGGTVLLRFRRKSQHRAVVRHEEGHEEEHLPADEAGDGDKREYDPLMERICQYMEEQKPYLDCNLKLQDVADALSTNRTYVADCIKVSRDMSFPVFVNTFRVEHAKQLLNSYPDMKIAAVGRESGFSSEASFFRSFKGVTGMAPKEWREKSV